MFACTGEDPPFESTTPPDGGGSSDASVTPNDGQQPTGDASKRACEGKTKPGGAAEFFCADFDGDPYDQGWTARVDRDASIDATTARWISPFRAIVAPVPAIADAAAKEHGAALEWTTTGAATLDHVDVIVNLNKREDNEGFPHLKGTVTLVSVDTSDGVTSVLFTRGGTVGGTPDFVGYYVVVEAKNPPNLTQFKVTVPLPNEVWTELKLVANLKNGTTDLLFNGLPVLTGVGSIKHTTTSATVRVGAMGRSATIEHEFRYDDVSIAVFR